MKNNSLAEQLTQELLTNPSKFNEEGKAYKLLQEYFQGYPVGTLHPLLIHSDWMVRRAGVFVANELGIKASSMIHEATSLLNDGDDLIRWWALEIVMVCSFGENVGEFTHVIRALEHENGDLRRLAMSLVSNADVARLEAGIRCFETLGPSSRAHQKGLSDLLKCNLLHAEEVLSLINSTDPLARRYGAIASRRLFKKFPELNVSATSNADSDVRQFALDTSKSIGFFKPDKGKRHLYPDTYFDGD